MVEAGAETAAIWITGGGTREAIDDVRYVGNRSTGRLALSLSEAALARGRRVRLMIAVDVLPPASHPRLEVDRFESARELGVLLARSPGPRALIHAAAVADYAPEAVAGKFPSGQDEWTLKLTRLPKVVDAFRDRHPDAHLTLFKLESGIEAEELLARARRAGGRVGARQIFANLLREVTADRHSGWLVPADPRVEPLRLEGREAVVHAILDGVDEDGASR